MKVGSRNIEPGISCVPITPSVSALCRVGATTIVVLTACFPQDRGAFLVGLGLWSAACALLATPLAPGETQTLTVHFDPAVAGAVLAS